MKGLVQSLLGVSSAQAAPGADKAIGDAVSSAIKNSSEGNQRLRAALDLLKAGKPAEAEPLFRAVAEEKGAKIEQNKKDAAAAYRNLGAIAGLGDPKKAREAYAKALEFDGDDLESLFWHGKLHNDSGNLLTAEKSLGRLLDVATNRANARGVFRAHWELGYLMKDRGNLQTAREHEQAAVDVAKRESSTSPNDSDWKLELELARGQVRVGDVLVAQGNLPEALKYFQDGLSIGDRLAKSDPGKAGWQRDLSFSHAKLADAHRRGGDNVKAGEHLRAGRAIIAKLVAYNPGWSEWKRDLTWFDGQIAALEGK